MRGKKKTTIITFESRQSTTIKGVRRRLPIWCDRCEAEVLMLTPQEAAFIAGTDARTIFRSVESGQVHFVENADGTLLICKQSIDR